MIAVELALLTAVALFFSTFSSSALLSVVFTLGISWLAVSARTSRFRRSLTRWPLVARPWRRSDGSCRHFRRSTSRRQVVHGIALPHGFVLDTLAIRGALYRGAAPRGGRHDLLAAGIQVTARASTVAGVGWWPWIGRTRGQRARTRATRTRPLPAPSGRARCRCIGRPRGSAFSCRLTRWPPTCTGSGRSSTTAATDKSSADDGRFDLLQPLLDLTTTLDPQFNVAYRFGADLPCRSSRRTVPAGPIRRLRCSRRACAPTPGAGSTRTTSGSLTTGTRAN